MGVCPDAMVADRSCRNDIVNVSGSLNNRQQCVLFTRPLAASKQSTVLFNIIGLHFWVRRDKLFTVGPGSIFQ